MLWNNGLNNVTVKENKIPEYENVLGLQKNYSFNEIINIKEILTLIIRTKPC